MRRHITVRTFTSLWLLLSSLCAAQADCRGVPAVAKSNEPKIVVSFAVPVGVPVAPLAPYYYSYQQYRQPGRGMWDEARVSRPAVATEGDFPSLSLAPRLSALVNHCASCHGGSTPKAGLSLEHPDQLSAATRLAAIRAIATGRMPRNKLLTPDESRAVIEELTNTQND
jgi:cytochrome c553